jgi:stage II sporulation protein D
VIPKVEVADALAKSGQALNGISVTARSASGRAKQITVGLGPGRQVAMAASEFRLIVGPAKLPSAFFEVREVAGGYEFQGRGFGHGVGMCQWGARGMAEANFSAPEILRHYYTGAQLTRLYATRDM